MSSYLCNTILQQILCLSCQKCIPSLSFNAREGLHIWGVCILSLYMHVECIHWKQNGEAYDSVLPRFSLHPELEVETGFACIKILFDM